MALSWGTRSNDVLRLQTLFEAVWPCTDAKCGQAPALLRFMGLLDAGPSSAVAARAVRQRLAAGDGARHRHCGLQAQGAQLPAPAGSSAANANEATSLLTRAKMRGGMSSLCTQVGRRLCCFHRAISMTLLPCVRVHHAPDLVVMPLCCMVRRPPIVPHRMLKAQGVVSCAQHKATHITVMCKDCRNVKVLPCKPGIGGAMIPRYCDARQVAACPLL